MLSLSSEHSATSLSEQPALPAHASPASTGLPNDASQHPAGKPGKRSWLRIVFLILVVGGAISFVTYRIVTNKPAQQAGGGGGGRRGGGANAIVPVAFDVAQLKTIPIQLNALGTVTAYNTVTLKTRVDGQITKVNFQEGQRVRKGQLLIEIDPHPYEAALAQAQGNLARDEANAALAQVQAQRYNQLYAAGVVSKETNQTQESTAGQAVGTLAADRAAILAAQVNLNYTKVVSPIDGIVGLRQVDIGNIVTASSATGLVVITQVQPIAVIFTLPEDQLPQVFDRMHGKKLIAEAWDRSNSTKLATGSLLTVDNQIDTTTGTAKLKAVFDNNDNSLYPNQFVNIHLVLEDRPNSLVIPAAAIQTGNNSTFVYVIDRTQGTPVGSGASANGARAGGNAPAAATTTTQAAPAPADGAGAGTAGGRRGGAGGPRQPQTAYPVHVTNVVVDSTQGTNVIIKSGLTPGQQVVTDGTEKLQDNSKVIPRPSTDMQAERAARGANGGGNAPGAGNGKHGDRGAAAPGGAAAGDNGSGKGQGGTDGQHHHRPATN
jgi:multidrug efflux system membrane fusion protein